jgi:hypothetical protein
MFNYILCQLNLAANLILYFIFECICFRSSGVEPALPSSLNNVDAIPLDQESILPHCDPIPPESIEHSKPWVEVCMTAFT